ncbi:MAG: hypothetical protein ABIR66_01425 [Saprospiraceae bacterium]
MKHIILLLSILFFVMRSFCQDYKLIDSINQRLLNEKVQDTNTVYLYLALSSNYTWSKPDSAIFYGNKGLILSKLLHFKKGEFLTLTSLSFPLAIVRSDSASVSYAYSVIKIAEDEKNKDDLLLADYILGSVYLYIIEYNKALIPIRRSMDPEFALMNYANQHLAQSFLGLNETDSAFYYIHKVLEYNKQHKKINAFDVYLLGTIYYNKAIYDSALMYYREALNI